MKKGDKKVNRFKYLLYQVLVLFFVLFFLNPEVYNNGLEFIMMDIGQGDSILIKTPLGQKILVDTGPNYSKLKKGLDRNLKLSENEIDFLIITHHDNDHVGGLKALVNQYDVRNVIDPRIDLEEGKSWVKDLYNDKGLNVHGINSHQDLEIEPGLKIDVLYPDPSYKSWGKITKNNKSFAFLLDYKGEKFFLSGDGEKDQEFQMLKLPLDYSAKYYKAGHHGSKTSSTYELVKSINPEKAFISYGKDNRFGHPHESIIERLNNFEIEIQGTGGGGDLKVRNKK